MKLIGSIRVLPVELNDHEILQRGRLLSKLSNDRRMVELEKSAKAKEFSNRLKDIDGEIAKLSEVIETGQEPRDVKCQIEIDYQRKEHRVRRLDTDEVISCRALTESEQQMELVE